MMQDLNGFFLLIELLFIKNEPLNKCVPYDKSLSKFKNN